MYDRTNTIEQFLNSAAARQPTPGGGSVAALVGALGASMGEMVVNYSLGKKGLEAHSDEFIAAVAKLHRIRSMMLELMVEDQQAFEALSAARKLPQTDAHRVEAIKSAVLVCIRVPESIAATAISILDIADSLVDISNRFLLTDLAVCADLAMATTRAAIYNVRVNLQELTDANVRQQTESEISRFLTRGLSLIQRIFPKILARLEPAK